MAKIELSQLEESVVNVVKENHLTSYEILKKVENVSMILSLYNILDQLNNKGVIKSYIKQDLKYHYAA
jgi:Fe2+ or Zn2+ uptake regulation protein